MTAHTETDALVDASWVQDRLDVAASDAADLRLVEVDMDPDNYTEAHIPGAVRIDWEADFAGELGRDVVERTEFAELVGSLGITPDTTVVVYGDRANWFAAHAYWVFTYFGHDDVRLLDGGRGYWLSQDLPTTTDEPSFTERDYAASAPDEEIRASLGEVQAAIDDETPIIDVRNPREYRGDSPPADVPNTTEREGHIPGAENVHWAEAVGFDGRFKPADQLREIYADYLGDDGAAVTYCRIGERSSITWFVLHELLGADAANYDGSWTEWADHEATAVETGENPSSAPIEGDD